MIRSSLVLIFLPFIFSGTVAHFDRVDADLKVYEEHLANEKAKFETRPANPANVDWVKSKLQFMFDIDQYMRKYPEVMYDHHYSEAEIKYFREQFLKRNNDLDHADTEDLKSLLKVYDWFRISIFGAEADSQAWIIVQHADLDPDFQKAILPILEKLYPSGETSAHNYAYLFDRVAASWNDETKRTLQRYGTQGTCKGPQQWEPIPMEDPAHVDERRAAMGLSTMAEYLKLVQPMCH